MRLICSHFWIRRPEGYNLHTFGHRKSSEAACKMQKRRVRKQAAEHSRAVSTRVLGARGQKGERPLWHFALFALTIKTMVSFMRCAKLSSSLAGDLLCSCVYKLCSFFTLYIVNSDASFERVLYERTLFAYSRKNCYLRFYLAWKKVQAIRRRICVHLLRYAFLTEHFAGLITNFIPTNTFQLTTH